MLGLIDKLIDLLIAAGVHIHYEGNGRATGEADVEFESHLDAAEAMKKDKQVLMMLFLLLLLVFLPTYFLWVIISERAGKLL